MSPRTLEERAAYKEGFEAGITQGLGNAVRILMDAGIPPEHHNPIHRVLDERLADPKRQPRARADWP